MFNKQKEIFKVHKDHLRIEMRPLTICDSQLANRNILKSSHKLHVINKAQHQLDLTVTLPGSQGFAITF